VDVVDGILERLYVVDPIIRTESGIGIGSTCVSA